MAEWSKAPDSRYNLTLYKCLVFWSTYVGVGSNPTPDKVFRYFFLFFLVFFIVFFIFIASSLCVYCIIFSCLLVVFFFLNFQWFNLSFLDTKTWVGTAMARSDCDWWMSSVLDHWSDRSSKTERSSISVWSSTCSGSHLL